MGSEEEDTDAREVEAAARSHGLRIELLVDKVEESQEVVVKSFVTGFIAVLFFFLHRV